MGKTDNWRKPFFTLYIGQAFSLLSSSAVQFAIIWCITIKTGSAEIVMKKNGDITISGGKINIKGSGDIVMKGSKITQN